MTKTERRDLCDECLQHPGVVTCERCQKLLCEECGHPEALHDCYAPEEDDAL